MVHPTSSARKSNGLPVPAVQASKLAWTIALLTASVRQSPMPQPKTEPISKGSYSVDQDILRKLEIRLGPLHARQRLGIERDHEAQVFGQGLTFFHLENSSWAEWIIRNVLKATGLYWRARQNAERILVKRNDMRFKTLPPLFEDF